MIRWVIWTLYAFASDVAMTLNHENVAGWTRRRQRNRSNRRYINADGPTFDLVNFI